MTAITLELASHDKDLGGGFMVRRLLPSAQRQSVGPFLFFDHFGPVTVLPGAGHDVRPHPHIGLSTVTYLFEGAITHRDSLGYLQDIEPGAINWMTAGRGIVHSERQPERLRQSPYVNHGIQLWAALPVQDEECEPSFVHTPADAIPEVALAGAKLRVLVGEAFGARSPVVATAGTIYLDVELEPGASMVLEPLAPELALYGVSGNFNVDGQNVAGQRLAVLAAGRTVTLKAAEQGAHLMVLGGMPLDGHRLIAWNFVSSRKERIVQASRDWAAGRMGAVPGDTEFLPLPQNLAG